MITNETRKKLSNAAKLNGLGGAVLVNVICTKCNNQYKGISNQLICKPCKSGGYIQVCKHCHNDYTAYNNDYIFCCISCKKSKPWLRTGRENIGNIISKAKTEWYQTEDGKAFAKRIGKINSKKMIEFNKTPKGIANIEKNSKLMSTIMKEKISNGEFTPPITNTWTHWTAIIGNKKFRSSWEACFWNSNKHLLYESKECRTIPQENGRVYMGDFFDMETKTLYEIKPKAFYIKQSKKIDSLIQHCKDNRYIFKWINEFNITDYINEADFDTSDEIEQLNKLKNGIKKS